MKENIFRYGENNRGLGMITLPNNVQGVPVVVMLNSGLLHRAEPYRLNVLTGRRLAEIGYICLRVDLSGKGDTPARKELTNRESVALDWRYIKQSITQSFGQRNIIVMGLCSGADNCVKIAAQDSDVKGLILMDSVANKDDGFNRRKLLNYITNIYKWPILLKKIFKIIGNVQSANDLVLANRASLRDPPNDQDFRQCFAHLMASDGKILAIFTGFALSYYNIQGQFVKGMATSGLDHLCEEIFWPNVMHLYSAQEHRDRLIKAIATWCETHFDRFCAKGAP